MLHKNLDLVQENVLNKQDGKMLLMPILICEFRLAEQTGNYYNFQIYISEAKVIDDVKSKKKSQIFVQVKVLISNICEGLS